MTVRGQIYKCDVCGNVVEVLSAGKGSLVCCGQPMRLLEEKTEGGGSEKHKPVVEKVAEGVKVRVGSTQHPMESEHRIEWIEVRVGGTVLRRFMEPGEPPSALFKVEVEEEVVARAYCNLHGLWRGP